MIRSFDNQGRTRSSGANLMPLAGCLSVSVLCQPLSWGNQGFFWVVDFELYPRFGGSSGGVWRYRALINPDGSLIQPERHLCDYLPLWKQKNGLSYHELTVFSHISFDDFASPVDDKLQLHGDQIMERATAAVSAFMEKKRPQGSNLTLRFREQQLAEIPVALKNDGQIVQRRLWKVQFVDGSLTGERIQSAPSLVVWVTPDGVVGKLSAESWVPVSVRKKSKRD